MISYDFSFTTDLEKNDGAVRKTLEAPLYYGDNKAQTIRVAVKRNGVAADLTGLTPKGYLVNEETGVTQDISDHNEASIDIAEGTVSLLLNSHVYEGTGRICIVVQLTSDDSTTTILALYAWVSHGVTDTIEVPTGDRMSLAQIEALIDDLNDIRESYDETTYAAEIDARRRGLVNYRYGVSDVNYHPASSATVEFQIERNLTRLTFNGNLSTSGNMYKAFLTSVDGIHTYPTQTAWGSHIGEGIRLTDGHTYRLRIHEVGGTLESYNDLKFFPRWSKKASSYSTSVIGDTSHTNTSGTNPEQYTDLLYDASLYDDYGVYASIQLRHSTKIEGKDYAAIATDYQVEVTITDITSTIPTKTVTGTTPTIVADPGMKYDCGTLAELDFTPCSSGLCEVVFTSGTTATQLTLPATVRMPDWWSGVEANRTYDIMVMDGIYGAVMSWAT